MVQPSPNPYGTSNGAGLFNIQSVGLIQGTAYADPAVRFALSGGILGPNETLPMWGGCGVSVTTTPVAAAAGSPSATLGGYVTRATTLAAAAAGSMVGFSVFDQNYAAIIDPGYGSVPLSYSYNLVNYYRFGSGARISVACVPSLVSLEGNIITQQVSWDFVNQQLIPYEGSFAADTITGAVWANTAGGQTTYTVTTDLTADLNAGDYITVTGVVSTGGTGVGFNGTFVVVSVTSTTIVVTDLQPSSPGTYASGGTVVAGGGALPVRVLDVNIGNCMTVNYVAGSGASWNYNNSCAVILI